MTGEVWCVLASGPSLGFDNYADVKAVEASGLKTIAVNNTWEFARFADVIYAGDFSWWKINGQKIDIDAERWSCSKPAAKFYNGDYRARNIGPGYNSGANAVDLAANEFSAEAVIMLGFDCSLSYGAHHHGNHEKTKNPNQERMPIWSKQFDNLSKKCGTTRLINCSRHTEIKSIERMNLNDALKELMIC